MKTIFWILKIAAVFYVVSCIVLYLIQEKLIFLPEKLPDDYIFHFAHDFEELTFRTADKTNLSGLLFTTEHPKGLIFYLHGNAGSLCTWGDIAKTYTDLQYDVFMLDYRGYGKSSGSINSEHQMYEDVQQVYDSMLLRYAGKQIIVAGYSIGTGPAAWLAASNHPGLLILQAPFFSLTDMLRRSFPLIPSFVLKYKFSTNLAIKKCRMPVVIFHGNKDEVIYYGSSLKLQQHFKPTDTLVTLKGQGHNGMNDNPDYKIALQQILQRLPN